MKECIKKDNFVTFIFILHRFLKILIYSLLVLNKKYTYIFWNDEENKKMNLTSKNYLLCKQK